MEIGRTAVFCFPGIIYETVSFPMLPNVNVTRGATPMANEPMASMFEMILCLSQAVDLVSPLVADHHKRVTYIASCLAKELGLPEHEIRDIVVAAALHDVGGLSLKERTDVLWFEIENPYQHAEQGYLLLKTFPPFAGNVATLVRFHHVYWRHGAGKHWRDEPVPLGSHLLHLADRVSVLVSTHESILSQVEGICRRITGQAGEMFVPELVAAFNNLARREYFWLDAVSPTIDRHITGVVKWEEMTMGMENLFGLTKLFCRIIDFRSTFTSTHTCGVAACAEALARMSGFSEVESQLMKVAGFIHDLGKLAVPVEILEKQAGLSKEEFDIIRTHAYHTDQILVPIKVFDTIRSWGALHHERLDGAGYPYHLRADDLSAGSRIMAVADVFVALAEDRPYREGMSQDNVLEVMQKMAESGALDADILVLLRTHFNGQWYPYRGAED
jgi:HD-GYP domain-containing protein (c-di-GMP phosphodiesterase class II)